MMTASLLQRLRPAALFLLIGLPGCGAVDSPASFGLPDDQKASISGKFFQTHLGPSRVTVFPLPNDEVGRPVAGYPGTVNLAAGPQRLFVNRCSGGASALSCRDPWFAEFEAEAGRDYAVNASRRRHYWIVDTETGNLVADSLNGARQAVVRIHHGPLTAEY